MKRKLFALLAICLLMGLALPAHAVEVDTDVTAQEQQEPTQEEQQPEDQQEPQEYTLQHIQYSGWAEQAIQTAVANGWIEDRADVAPDAVISRGQLEQLINGVLALYR